MKRIIITLTVLVSLIALILMGSLYTRIFQHKEINKRTEDSLAEILPESVQINIFNATVHDGLAAEARIFLRNKGIDVVEIGNFAKLSNYSYIIDRQGDLESSRKLADAIGMKDSLIVTEIDSSLFLKCSLILGNDYKKYLTKKPDER